MTSSFPLERYRGILSGREKAGYLKLKQYGVDFDQSLDDDRLWKLHRDEMSRFWAGETGEGEKNLLDLKMELARRILKRCEFCERRCGVNRTGGERGHCGVLEAHVSSDFLHMGEEPFLIPSYTIFFSGCTFDCVYCQNYDISTDPEGGFYIEPVIMADRIERRFRSERREWPYAGAKNVNWVGGDPTPNIYYIFQVLTHCRANIPQIWNSNMFLTVRSMELLDGVIDVYLTDFKYGNDECARRLSKVSDYVSVITRNHLIAAGQAEVVIRHLVLPGHVECCSIPVLQWIRDNLRSVVVNVMSQYRPLYKAHEYGEINRPLSKEEFSAVYSYARELGLTLVD